MRTKILEIVANGHVKCDCPSCKCKNNDFSSWFSCKNHTQTNLVAMRGYGKALGSASFIQCGCGVRMEWCDERGGKEEAELITSESSIPVFSSKLSHFLSLLHCRFLWGPISRSLSLSQGQRWQEDGELAWKRLLCCAVWRLGLI